MKPDVKVQFREDLPAEDKYLQLFETTGWNRGYGANGEELFAAISSSWYTLCGYHENGDLVGFARIVSDGILYAFICDMIVDPSFQNQGIGSSLLNQLIDACRGAGIRVVWLMAAAEKSGFYAKFGFKERPANAPGMQLNLNIKTK